jgi:glycosyltransferase involved in cell wall biosynthesis
MKVYFVLYTFTNSGTSGGDIYHYNLAQLMLSWGWQIRAVNNQATGVYEVDGVAVCPIAANGINYHGDNMEWCDLIISIPMLQRLCRKDRPKVFIKHNDTEEPFDFSNDNILFCGNWVRSHLKMKCRADYVWNPVNRYYGTDKRGNPDGPWIIVNCNDNKGGHRLIELAKMCPTVKFAGVLGAYGKQIQEELPNLEYWPQQPDMSEYYQRAAGLLSLSIREGFPTVVMEAMSHGLPVVGLKCPGFEDVLGYKGTVCNNTKEVGGLVGEFDIDEIYDEFSRRSLARASEIEASRDPEGLLKFLVE